MSTDVLLEAPRPAVMLPLPGRKLPSATARLLVLSGEPWRDHLGMPHRLVDNRTMRHCECLEPWPCRARLLAELGTAHPAEGWCGLCMDFAPCAVRRELLDQAVTQ